MLSPLPADLLMMGMLAVMITAAFWDNFACHLELPVSTTHTTGEAHKRFIAHWLFWCSR